jgi:hypothetical protein
MPRLPLSSARPGAIPYSSWERRRNQGLVGRPDLSAWPEGTRAICRREGPAANQVWMELVLAAQDLLAFFKRLCLEGEARR